MKLFPPALVVLSVFFLFPSTLAAEPYQTPSPALVKLVDQPSLPALSVSPDHRWGLLFHSPGVPSLEEVAGPELKLGGVRFDPTRYSPSALSGARQVELVNLESLERTQLAPLPEGHRIVERHWSPDSQKLVTVVKEHDGLRLWLWRPEDREFRPLSSERLNGVLGQTLVKWSGDSRSLLCCLVQPGEAPPANPLPTGPNVQVADRTKAPVRTFQDLLKDSADARTFHYYATSRLARIDLEGQVTRLGEAGVISSFQESPDGRYILQTVVDQPYSFTVGFSRFPGRYLLLSRDGRTLRTVARFPASEDLPKGFDSVRQGPRNMEWRDDQPATLVWAEALDKGDMKTEVPHHDRLLMWSAPFSTEPREWMKTSLRYSGSSWGNERFALVSEWRHSDRKTRTWKVDPSRPQADRVLLVERSYDDRYRDKGSPVFTQGPYGRSVLWVQGDSLLLQGLGASQEGNIPFLDRWNADTGQTERLWHSQAPYYERVAKVLSADGSRLITLRESEEEPANYFLRSGDDLEKLTDRPHPNPEFQGISKELITCKRPDGVELSGSLYLPRDYQGGRLPTLMWAYPREFKDSSVAGQRANSPYEFKQVSYWGPLPFLALGYAVFDNPTMPIVGEGQAQPNDTFRDQLVASAQAAVEVLVERGVSDPDRIAVGGHSYGAFMVANLLAHSDLFKTGIARSGAYNRTLTPFGFQGEERDFWEAKSVYSEMSPFFYAEKINEPLLLIHGEEDNNSGTFPMQSERMFSAIKGLGGRARLVMLPEESHGYRARESLLHMLWEEENWLRTHLGT